MDREKQILEVSMIFVVVQSYEIGNFMLFDRKERNDRQ